MTIVAYQNVRYYWMVRIGWYWMVIGNVELLETAGGVVGDNRDCWRHPVGKIIGNHKKS